MCILFVLSETVHIHQGAGQMRVGVGNVLNIVAVKRCSMMCSFCFLTALNLTPPNTLAPRFLSLVRPGSASAQVCSGLLTRNRQLLAKRPNRPSFPAKDPKSVLTYTHSQTVIIPVCIVFMYEETRALKSRTTQVTGHAT